MSHFVFVDCNPGDVTDLSETQNDAKKISYTDLTTNQIQEEEEHTRKKLKTKEDNLNRDKKQESDDANISENSIEVPKCNECDKTFAHKGSYKLHLLSHVNVKDFQCPVCDKKFKRGQDLKVHSKAHEGEFLSI